MPSTRSPSMSLRDPARANQPARRVRLREPVPEQRACLHLRRPGCAWCTHLALPDSVGLPALGKATVRVGQEHIMMILHWQFRRPAGPLRAPSGCYNLKAGWLVVALLAEMSGGA